MVKFGKNVLNASSKKIHKAGKNQENMLKLVKYKMLLLIHTLKHNCIILLCYIL